MLSTEVLTGALSYDKDHSMTVGEGWGTGWWKGGGKGTKRHVLEGTLT